MMEDEPTVKAQGGQSAGAAKMAGAVFAAIFLLCVWLGFAPSQVNPSIPSSKPAPATDSSNLSPEQVERVLKAVVPPAPAETKKEYIASTQKIGGKKATIYYKEFFKSPSKYEGQRINLPGKIMVIEEQDGKTFIQMQVTGNYDSVLVHYPSSVKVYQGDRIMVYGEGSGVQEGANRMGAAMTWPVISAKYIVKLASEEEY